eukprot:TRINITY_DN6503_c0_g1_i1.p1 TRINITY_DN6503_c0_g1~~TRINITY_DN6503_c0_g1_i1.p1  ORF type:complete len:341 (+),score=54.17 TRINITY_DN6503_c0_g1_i1:41-1063(+)
MNVKFVGLLQICRSLLKPERNLSYVSRVREIQKLKEDKQYCEQVFGSSGLYLLYVKGKPLLEKSKERGFQPKWIDNHELKRISDKVADDSAALLGLDMGGQPQFAISIDDKQDRAGEIEHEHKSRFTDLRAGLFLVDTSTAHTLSKGWSLLQWKKTMNYCSKCGGKLVKTLSGSQGACPDCKSVYYPQTSPVGIVSICDTEKDKLMLIRQPRYPPGMYSCIAGFLDVGESLEECVRREAAEEVGIEVDKVTYFGSQHWPFPAGSLMIGCQAEALPGQMPDPCKVELEDAKWFTREQVQEAVDRINKNPNLRVLKNNNPDEIFVPPRGAIAHHLVQCWLNQ